MFGKSATDSSMGERHGHSVIQEGVTIRGELEAKGDFRLDGRLEGRVSVSEKLTVGEKGVVIAEVDAGEVIVMGEIQGTIRAHRRVELRKSARVVGDITTPSLLIEEGVHFHGNSNMEVERATTPILKAEPPLSKETNPETGSDGRTAAFSGSKSYR